MVFLLFETLNCGLIMSGRKRKVEKFGSVRLFIISPLFEVF